MIHRQGLELEAAGAVLPVDLLPDGGVAHPPADIFVDGVIGKAQVVLVGEAGEAVGGGLHQELFRQAQHPAQGDDLLGGLHAQRGEGSGGVAVNGAVAHPVLGEVAGVDDNAGGQRLGHGIQGGHADAGGQVHGGLAAGGQARLLHLLQNALNGVVDVDGAVGDLQVLHQGLGIVDVRLDAVGHQHAVYVLPAIGSHSQRRHGAAVLAAGNADDGGFAAALGHLLVHPLQQARQLLLGIKFHRNAPPVFQLVLFYPPRVPMASIFSADEGGFRGDMRCIIRLSSVLQMFIGALRRQWSAP